MVLATGENRAAYSGPNRVVGIRTVNAAAANGSAMRSNKQLNAGASVCVCPVR